MEQRGPEERLSSLISLCFLPWEVAAKFPFSLSIFSGPTPAPQVPAYTPEHGVSYLYTRANEPMYTPINAWAKLLYHMYVQNITNTLESQWHLCVPGLMVVPHTHTPVPGLMVVPHTHSSLLVPKWPPENGSSLPLLPPRHTCMDGTTHPRPYRPVAHPGNSQTPTHRHGSPAEWLVRPVLAVVRELTVVPVIATLTALCMLQV